MNGRFGSSTPLAARWKFYGPCGRVARELVVLVFRSGQRWHLVLPVDDLPPARG